MILSKNNKAFTLIELIVWITIMWILAFAISNIDFNRLSNKQKLELFAWKIKTTYETVRNNSLAWRWIWTNLIIPQKRNINFSKNNSWTILWEAYDETDTLLDSYSLLMPNNIIIESIKCWEYWEDETNYNEMSNTWTIEFRWINIKLNLNSDANCDLIKDKILEIDIKDKIERKKIIFNTLNWLVEIK